VRVAVLACAVLATAVVAVLAALPGDDGAASLDAAPAGSTEALAGQSESSVRPADPPAPERDVRPTDAAEPDEAARPVRVRIRAVGVDAPVGLLGLQDDGTLEVPEEPDEAGWWRGGSAPGEPGPAVIVAHRDSLDGPALFYDVPLLEEGDEVEVDDADGRTHVFVVDRVQLHAKDAFPTEAVYGPTRRPTLRLLTCGGNYDDEDGYEDNYVVFARQRP
jgi:sortase (surface protein transpeptidase)